MKRNRIVVLSLTQALVAVVAVGVLVGTASATVVWYTWPSGFSQTVFWGTSGTELIVNTGSPATNGQAPGGGTNDYETELKNNAYLYMKGPTSKQAMLATRDDNTGNQKQAGVGVTWHDAFVWNWRAGNSLIIKGQTGDVEIKLGTPQS